MKKKNMATSYSDARNFPKFGSFIRAVIGLPFTPLERLEEAMGILEKMAKATTGARKSFCHQMLKYLRNVWLDGSIPRSVWNMYEHIGVTTNNNAEAFNFKMGNKKKISKHPNPYVLADVMKAEFKDGCDTAVAETVTSHKRKVDTNAKKLKDKKKGLMKDLGKRNIDLQTYLVSMGANTMKYQPQIQKDSDPLADIVSDGENFVDDFDEDDDNCGESIEQPQSPEVTQTRIPNIVDRIEPAKKKSNNKKGKKKKQKPIPGSEESFLHIESFADHDLPQQASIGGSDLRQLRREQAAEPEVESDYSSVLTAAAIASAGITVLSRFVSRSSASRSSPRRSSVGRRVHVDRDNSSVPRSSSTQTPPRRSSVGRIVNVDRNTSSEPLPSSHLAFSDQCSSAKHRVESLGFKFSSSQPFTQGDGNCMLHALMDQLKKCNHPILRKLTSSHDLRLYICSKLMEQIEGNHIFWVQTFSPESWLEKMRCNSYWCDDVFIQIAANILISISS